MFVAAVPVYSFFYPLPYATQSVRNIPLVVVDLDASPMSRDIVSRLVGGGGGPHRRQRVLHRRGERRAGRRADRRHRASCRRTFRAMRCAARQPPSPCSAPVPTRSRTRPSSAASARSCRAWRAKSTHARLARQGAPAAALLQSARAGPAFIDQPLYNLARGYGSYVVAAVGILIVQQVMLMAIAALVGTWLEARTARCSARRRLG